MDTEEEEEEEEKEQHQAMLDFPAMCLCCTNQLFNPTVRVVSTATERCLFSCRFCVF